MTGDTSEPPIESALEATRRWLPYVMTHATDGGLDGWWSVFWRLAESEHEKRQQLYSNPDADGQTRLVTDGGQDPDQRDIPTHDWWPAGCPVAAIEPDCGYCYGLLHRLARQRRRARGDAPATAAGDASLQAFADGGGG